MKPLKSLKINTKFLKKMKKIEFEFNDKQYTTTIEDIKNLPPVSLGFCIDSVFTSSTNDFDGLLEFLGIKTDRSEFELVSDEDEQFWVFRVGLFFILDYTERIEMRLFEDGLVDLFGEELLMTLEDQFSVN